MLPNCLNLFNLTFHLLSEVRVTPHPIIHQYTFPIFMVRVCEADPEASKVLRSASLWKVHQPGGIGPKQHTFYLILTREQDKEGLLLTETFFIHRYPSATPTLVGSEGMQQQFMFWSIARFKTWSAAPPLRGKGRRWGPAKQTPCGFS